MRRNQGAVMIVTLAVLAALVAVLAAAAASQHALIRSQADRQDRVRARRAAESGVQRAIASLVLLPSAAPNAITPPAGNGAAGNAQTLQDDWALLGQNGDEEFRVGRDRFRVQVVDAASRVNINNAPQEQLQNLPLTAEQIDSLLDFREADRNPRPLGGKDEYYGNLTQPYNTRLGNLVSLDEVLQVRNWTPATLFEPVTDVTTTNPLPSNADGTPLPLYEILTAVSASPQTDPEGNARLNVNNANAAAQLVQRGFSPQAAQIIGGRTNWGSLGEIVAAPGLQPNDQRLVLDNLATDAVTSRPGLLNINTAPAEILTTVPGITLDIAQAIVQRQGQGFPGLGELSSVPGVTAQVLQQAASRLTTQSTVFIVRVLGRSGQSTVALEAIVDMTSGTPRIRNLQEPPYPDPESRWGWQPNPATETVLSEVRA